MLLLQCSLNVRGSRIGAGATSCSTISEELHKAAFHIELKDIVLKREPRFRLGGGAFGEARSSALHPHSWPLLRLKKLSCQTCLSQPPPPLHLFCCKACSIAKPLSNPVCFLRDFGETRSF